jgi:hypothetical protein
MPYGIFQVQLLLITIKEADKRQPGSSTLQMLQQPGLTPVAGCHHLYQTTGEVQHSEEED